MKNETYTLRILVLKNDLGNGMGEVIADRATIEEDMFAKVGDVVERFQKKEWTIVKIIDIENFDSEAELKKAA